MILRKPYAAFIKHFKHIHLLLALGNAYLIYRTFLILNFLNEAISQTRFNISRSININLIDFLMYLIPILIIIVAILVLSVLAYKQKPFKFYAITVIIFIVICLFNFYLADYLDAMEMRLMTAQSLSLMRDFVLISILIEIATAIKFFITGVGFDIKNFDFGKDLAELEIEDVDREEFEVEFKLDVNKIKRDIARWIRNLKYSYYENKFKYNVIIFIFLIMLTPVVFNVFRSRVVALEEGEIFAGQQLLIGVNHSYLTTKNYRGLKVTDGYALLVVDLNVASRYSEKSLLEIAKIRIEVGNYSFYHVKKYRDSLFDLGIVYDEHKIGREMESYLLVFEIPENFVDRPLVFKYVDDMSDVGKKSGPSIQSVLLKPTNVDDNDEIYVTKMGDIMYFREPILISSLRVDEFDMRSEYKISYQFCIEANNCFTSYEYLSPGYHSNDEMIVLRLKGEFQIDQSIRHMNLNYADFLINFGVLRYQVDGKNKIFRFNQKVEPNRINMGSNTFLEVPAELIYAEQMEIEVKIRNYTYKHLLK